MRAMIAFALCMLACTASDARPYTVDDLLGLESYGQALMVPSQDLLLVEKLHPYTEAADFAYDTYFTSRMVTRIMVTSLGKPGRLQPLFSQEDQAGYWIAGLSPRQTRLAVFRLADRRLSLGVVDLSTRAVRWLEPQPDLPAAAASPVWIDEDHLAYVAMTRDRLPASLSMGTAGTSELNELWRRQARGDLTRTLVSTRAEPEPDYADRRLVVVSVADGSTRVLARGNIVDLSISPRHDRLAIVTAGVPVAPAVGPINGSFDSRRHRLSIVDIVNGQATAIDGDVLRGVMSWSAEGQLLVVTRSGGADWSQARWTIIDQSGGAASLGGADAYAAVDEVPGGRFAYADWAGNSSIALVRIGRRRLWARLRKDGVAELPFPPAARPAGATAGIKWMLDDKLLYAVSASQVRPAARDVEQAGPTIVDPLTRGFRLVRDPNVLELVIVGTESRRSVRPFTSTGRLLARIDIPAGATVLAAGSDRALVRQSDDHAVTRLSLVQRDRPAIEIDRVNDMLAKVKLPRVVELKTRGPGGGSLQDWLLLPATGGAKLPLIVNPYPGLAYGSARPHEADINGYGISDNALLLVSAGYAVLLPSMPLLKPGNPAHDILPRIDAATDAAIATGLVDPERIGLMGHSFGGYAALLVATRSNRYKAIVGANGPYDLFAMHGTMPVPDRLRLDYGIPAGNSIGWTEGGQGGMGASPATAAEAYVAASPMLHLYRVHSPILLIAGDLDFVDIIQSERAFMELYRHGKDARLARYWGENHTNASPANIRDYWQLITAFFDEHLKASPGPDHSAARSVDETTLKPSRR